MKTDKLLRNFGIVILTFVTTFMLWSGRAMADAVVASGNCGKTEEDNVTWVITGDTTNGYTLTIDGTGEMVDYGGSVTFEYYSYHENVKKVVIGAGITSVGRCAFADFKSIEEVKFEGSPIRIGGYAFKNAFKHGKEVTVNIPDSVKVIEINAFCTDLYSKLVIEKLPDSLEILGENAFMYSGLKKANLGNKLTCVPAACFGNCAKLTEIELPSNIEKVEHDAFKGCTKVTTISIANKDIMFEFDGFSDCFGNCGNITTVYLPHITGGRDFGIPKGIEIKSLDCDCPKVKSSKYPKEETDNVYYYEGLYCHAKLEDTFEAEDEAGFTTGKCGEKAIWEIGERADGKYELVISGSGDMYDYYEESTPLDDYMPNIQKATIGDDITSIGGDTFYESGIRKVTIGNKVKTIGKRAFIECKNLTSVVFPESLTGIEEMAFKGCESLETVTIPKSVTYMGSKVFECNYKLKSVTFDSPTVAIPIAGFYECKALKTLELPNTITDIGEEAFCECTALQTVKIGKGVENIGEAAFKNCEKLESVDIAEGVTHIGIDAFWKCKKLKKFVIPDSVKSMGDSVFYKAGLEEVVIGKGLTKLEEFCFDETKLKKVEIPDNIKVIGESAFEYIDSLEEVVISDGVTEIEEGLFIKCTGLKHVSIGKGIKTIPSFTFQECSALEELVIPDNVETISDSVFGECNNLQNIYIGNGLKELDSECFYGFEPEEFNLSLPDTFTQVDKTEWRFPENAVITYHHTLAIKDSEEYLKTAPTCEDAGEYYYFCTYCQTKTDETYEVPALGHTKSKVNNKEYLKSAATCTTPTTYCYSCERCNYKYPETYVAGAALGHSTKEVVLKKAGFKSEGLIENKCARCGLVKDKKILPKVYAVVEDTVKLNKKGSKAKVTLLTSDGNKLSTKEYNVKYTANKKVGKATVKITLKGDLYTGTLSKKFVVANSNEIPKKATVKSASLKNGKLTVSWKKVAKPATGIELQYSEDPNFLTKVKVAKVSKLSTTSKTIKGVKTGTEYYVRIRSFAKNKKYTAYGAWSKAVSVK